MLGCPHNDVIFSHVHPKMCFEQGKWGTITAPVWEMQTGLSGVCELRRVSCGRENLENCYFNIEEML